MTSKTKSVIVVILAASLVGAVWSFLHFKKAGGTNTLRVGVLIPMSGDSAVWGTSMRQGIDLARDQLNEERGQTRPAVDLSYEDDRGLPNVGVSALQKLMEVDRIRGLVGVANSSVALAVIPIIDERKTIFVSGGASSPKLSGSSKYFFRTWPSDLAEAVAMAKYVRGREGMSQVAILYINNEYGIGLRDPFMKEFQTLGGEIVREQAFPQESVDFRAQLTAVQRENPQGIYLVGNPREMGRCLKQASELGIKTQFFSTSAFVNSEVLNIAGSAANGVILTDASFDPKSPYAETQKFIKDFQEKYHQQPGMLAVTGYDALRVVVYAFDRTDGTSDRIVEFIRNLRAFPGAGGPISFDAQGDVQRPVRISTVVNGQFVTKEYLQ
jgi:branched-chain amino acid transport system substrate-binding protein